MHNKAEIIEQLRRIQMEVANTIQTISEAQFYNGTDESWSAANYLKHLILSIKPFAKGLNLPPEQLAGMFGTSERPSVSFDELVTTYKQRISEGVRAEDNQPVFPMTYRIPEGTTNEKAYLLQTWDDANNRLIAALEKWQETDLDTHQLPHPAVGLITIREMLFFTIHHNTIHGQDIERVGVTP